MVSQRSYVLFLLLTAASNALVFPVYGEEFDVNSTSLHILWSTPIIVNTSPPTGVAKPYIRPYHEKGLALEKSATFADGSMVFLGTQFDSPSYNKVLLTNIEQHGPVVTTELQLRGALPDPLDPPSIWNQIFHISGNKPSDIPSISSLAIYGSETIWVGGSTHYYTGMASDPHSDAYLAKLDGAAQPVWERAYKTAWVPFVVGMLPTSTGDLVVVTQNGWLAPSWLAMIAASDGHVIWERHLGNGKGIAMVPAHGDRFLVATFEAKGAGKTYQENVSVYTVSADGQLSSGTILRQSINKYPGAHFGNLNMSATDDGAYVVSNWEDSALDDTSRLKPLEIARVSSEGALLWSKELRVLLTDRGTATLCSNPAIATLRNGDALVACARNGLIHLYKFDRHTGSDEEGILPLPECNDGILPNALFLFVRTDGAVFLSGSRPRGNVGPGCSWVGRLTSTKEQARYSWPLR